MLNAPPWSVVSHLRKRKFVPRRKEPRLCGAANLASLRPLSRHHSAPRNRGILAWVSCVVLCRRSSSPSTQALAPLPSQWRLRSSLPCGSGELEASWWGRRSAAAHRRMTGCGALVPAIAAWIPAAASSSQRRSIAPPPLDPCGKVGRRSGAGRGVGEATREETPEEESWRDWGDMVRREGVDVYICLWFSGDTANIGLIYK